VTLKSEDEIGTASRRWALLVTVGAGLLLITLDNSILYTALPSLTTDLGASVTQSLWIVNAYPLVMAGLLLGAGTLGDRVGHARMFVAGLVIFGAASVLAALAPTPEVLIASRAVLAVGAAVMMPATLALIRINFPDERERNLAIAIWGSLAVIGAALGPIVGGVLLQHFWWGSVFLVNVPIVVAALVAIAVIRPASEADPGKRWDAVSSIHVMVGLAATVYAIKEIGHRPPSLAVVAISLTVAAVGFTLFVRRQRTLDEPLLEFSIFRNPAFTSGVLAAAASMFAIAGIQLVTTQRYQLVAEFNPLEAGLLVSAIAVGSLPTAMLGGAFLHRVGLLVLICGGLALSAVGVVVTVIGFGTSFGLLVAGLLVTGAGLGAAMAVASTAIIGNVPVRRAGMASSVEEVSYEFGSLTAVALLGSLLAMIYSVTVDLPDGTPAAAGEALVDALAVAEGDQTVIDAASSAFDTAYLGVMGTVAVMLTIGAAVTGILLRRHLPGTASQLPSDC
jgi:MFS transporter, DHA2 family, multidrug resistance protein